MIELKRKKNFHATVDVESFDLEEGDPCVAAEARLKRRITPLSVICCFAGLFLVGLLVVLLFIGGSSPESHSSTTASQMSFVTQEPTEARQMSFVTQEPTEASQMPIVTQEPTEARQMSFVTQEPTEASQMSIVTQKPTDARQMSFVTQGPYQTCGEYFRNGYISGVYELSFPGGKVAAYCEMHDEDGWAVLQKRTGPELRFWDRTFDEYSRGFGDLGGDHWWGLEKVRALGSGGRQLQMRIIVKGDFCVDKEKDYCSGQGKKGYWYGDWLIEIADRDDCYRMKEISYLRGNLSHPQNDFFSQYAKGQCFTTVDADHDQSRENCALHNERGGWWHKNCSVSRGFLNGQYGGGGDGDGEPKRRHYQYWLLWTEKGQGMPFRIKPMSSVMMIRVVK